MVGAFEVEHHGALGIQMVSHGTCVVKALRLNQNDLKLGGRMDIDHLIAPLRGFRAHIDRRRFLRLGYEIHSVVNLFLKIIFFRIAHKILDLSKKLMSQTVPFLFLFFFLFFPFG